MVSRLDQSTQLGGSRRVKTAEMVETPVDLIR